MSKRSRSRWLSLGPISEGTLRYEDLIPAFLYAAGGLHLTHQERQLVRAIKCASRCEGYYRGAVSSKPLDLDSDIWAPDYVANELLPDLLQAHCPDYTYFGSHPGNGACFGVWPALESLKEDVETGDVVKVEDLSEVLPGEARPILLVNDHGNVTLYYKTAKEFKEIWSYV
jgi:hypothetical protein